MIGYQSADCSYSAKIQIEDNPKQVRRAIRRLEKVVEEVLAEKLKQQQRLLRALAVENR